MAAYRRQKGTNQSLKECTRETAELLLRSSHARSQAPNEIRVSLHKVACTRDRLAAVR